MNTRQSGAVTTASSATVTLILVAGAGLLTRPLHAQTAVGAESEQTLQEVVVTAERRESTVQKTPFSITAISGQQMQAQGLVNLEDVASLTAGISMRTSGPGQTEYDMRGLTS